MRVSENLGRVAACIACFAVATVANAAPAIRVAVLELNEASQDPALRSLGKGLQEMLTTDLSNASAIQVVERSRLRDVQRELRLSNGQDFDKATAARVGKLAGATHLFVGSYTVVGGKMRIDGRLVAADTGSVMLADAVTGEKDLFFELEKQLANKLVAALGVTLAPKERAAMARPHTADFKALLKFSDGLQAFDDGKLDDAVKALNQATAIDADFKLASLTLDEYERLASQVRAKAQAAGRVEDELGRLERNKVLSAEVSAIKRLWPFVALKGSSPDVKLKRVAAACLLANAYKSQLGFANRGPVTAEDLADAGFDQFYLDRTAEALFAKAWADAPDVFPRVPPLCIGFGSVSSSSTLDGEALLRWHIDEAAKLTKDASVVLSYMANDVHVDRASEMLHLDGPGEVKLWDQLYTLAKKLPDLTDENRASFERKLAEKRRSIGDLDGSTRMFAAASKHTQDSYQLKKIASEIEANKLYKQALASGDVDLRELFVLKRPNRPDELTRQPRDKTASDLEWARRVRGRSFLLLGDTPAWAMLPEGGWTQLRSGARTTDRRTDELQYEKRQQVSASSELPLVLTNVRGVRLTLSANVRTGGANGQPARAGLAFDVRRPMPEGGIKRGAPVRTIGYAVMLDSSQLSLVKLTRDGEHNVALVSLASRPLPAAPNRERNLTVSTDSSMVTATVDGLTQKFPWKPDGDPEGFAGVLFDGAGVATVSHPAFAVTAPSPMRASSAD